MYNTNFTKVKLILLIFLLISELSVFSQTVSLDGTMQKWDKITLDFTVPGVELNESANTFRNRRMDVLFTDPNGNSLRVPGFFAANGNAANSGATTGNIYRAFLRPNVTGSWTYQVLFYAGNDVALSDVSSLPAPQFSLNGVVGDILESNVTGVDLRSQGRLQYQSTGTDNARRYLRFAETGDYYLKLGPDSPENLLDFDDFDFAADRISCSLCVEHSFDPHASDFDPNDPTWGDGRGQNIIGAINYIREQGMNSISMSLFGGDDRNVFPWISRNSTFEFDVSKLSQWEIVFDHAEKNGLLLHFKLAENENWDALTTDEIRVYYREMVARFGHHLALEWNISEEYRGTAASSVDRINFLAAIDPWKNHRVIHTFPGEHKKYQDWLNLNVPLTGASIQSPSSNNYNNILNGSAGILTWINNSRDNGTPWVVACDEQNSGARGVFTSGEIDESTVVPEARTRVLWKTLMAGGAGVMWYGGSQGDFRTENFDRFSTLFKWTRFAILDFFKGNNIEYWKMINSDNLVTGNGNNCLAEQGESYVIYLENGGSTNLNLNGQSGTYDVKWFDPRNGGAMQTSNIATVNGGSNVSIGNPPNTAASDWAVLVTRQGAPINLAPTVSFENPSDNEVFVEGTRIGVIALPLDQDGTVTNVQLFLDGALVRQENVSPYNWGADNSLTADPVLSNLSVGTHTLLLKVTDNQGAISLTDIDIFVEPSVTNPIGKQIPGRIEAENFDNQNGILTETTRDIGGGKNVGYINSGDFVEYEIDVATTGEYHLDFRVASNTSGGEITVLSNENTVGSVTVPGTGGWQTWITERATVTLPAGPQTVRLAFGSGSGFLLNVNYVDFSLVNTIVQQEEITVSLSPVNDAYLHGGSLFNTDIVRIENGNRVGYLMYDLSEINGTISAAELSFNVTSDAGSGTLEIALGSSDNWDENNLTTTNSPTKGISLGSINDSYPIGSTKTVALDHSLISGDLVSLILTAISGNDFALASKENMGVPAPELSITYLPTSARTIGDVSKKSLENPENSIISVYPNPAGNYLNLRNVKQVEILSVVDINGRVMKVDFSDSSEGTRLDITQLEAGMYFIFLEEASLRFIKN